LASRMPLLEVHTLAVLLVHSLGDEYPHMLLPQASRSSWGRQLQEQGCSAAQLQR
jgi:hypothetical protein